MYHKQGFTYPSLSPFVLARLFIKSPLYIRGLMNLIIFYRIAIKFFIKTLLFIKKIYNFAA